MKKETEEPTATLPVDELSKKEKVVEIMNLYKSFGNLEVIKNLSLSLYNGENLIVLGKSGSGKSVLIKCMVRLLNADRGSINIMGQDILKADRKSLSLLRQKIGFLFQSGAIYDSMTVKQNLLFPLKRIIKNLSQKEMNEKVLETLENVGLADAIDKMPSQLSGGMRKRISLARTIIVEPSIMLYDEPTTGLDPVTSDEISALINTIQKKYKTSSIIITHDIECVRATANRILMIQDGNIYKEGILEEFEKSEDPLIRAFFKHTQ